ncbi:MAG: NAD(P)-dependent oxidoreductase [Deltaproteobacteria bacterium]|nr:NAD(P)-dependent oxidoreductase [Deltaproteobacteria bacterium]
MHRLGNKRFLITGISKFPANKIVKFLVEHKFDVIGVDIRFPAFNPPGIRFYETDPYFSNIGYICKSDKVDIVVHLMFDYDIYSENHPYNRNNFIRFERLFNSFEKGLFEKLYIFSSSLVYGVNFSNNSKYVETDTLIASSSIAYLNDMLVIERYLTNYFLRGDDKGLFLFRIAPLYHNFSEDIVIKYLKKVPLFFSIAQRDPEYQFLYITDLINYILNSVVLSSGGIFNIASSDTIRLSELAVCMNRPFIYIPESLSRGVFKCLKFISRSELYNQELIDILSFPCLVSIDKARKRLNYEPEYGCRDLIENITLFE